MARGKAPAIKGPEDFAKTFSVSRETLTDFERYAALLARWQKAQNLVARGTLDQVWERHFADSAQLLALAPDARRWLDLGSGAGFPGMVVAILLKGREGARVDLIESNARKCAFLDAVRRETGAPARVHALRIEDAANQLDGPFDAVTARALAPLVELAPLIAPFLTGHTRALLPKGRDVASELTEASRYWIIGYETFESLTDSQARILMVHALERRQFERR
jgi:16S rRNA (guanine527-N7)-methyltransferase